MDPPSVEPSTGKVCRDYKAQPRRGLWWRSALPLIEGGQERIGRWDFFRGQWVLSGTEVDYNRRARQAHAKTLRGAEVSVDMYAGRTLDCKQWNKALHPVVDFSELAWSGPGFSGAWRVRVPFWQPGPE